MKFFLPVIQAFNQKQIDYLVVGGLAVVLHGHPRLTTDIDLVVGLEENNALSAIKCLVGLGFQAKVPVNPEDFSKKEIRDHWVQEKGLVVFTMFHPSDPLTLLDIFVEEPLPFADMMSDAQIMKVETTDVRIVSIDHLIEMKQKAMRPKDIEDIEALSEIKKI